MLPAEAQPEQTVDSQVPFGEGLTGLILLEDKQGALHSGTHQGNRDRSVDSKISDTVCPQLERELDFMIV